MGKEKKKRKGKQRRKRLQGKTGPRLGNTVSKRGGIYISNESLSFLGGIALGYGLKKLLSDLCADRPHKPDFETMKNDD